MSDVFVIDYHIKSLLFSMKKISISLVDIDIFEKKFLIVYIRISLEDIFKRAKNNNLMLIPTDILTDDFLSEKFTSNYL
jgi:hypothetical protein